MTANINKKTIENGASLLDKGGYDIGIITAVF